MAFNIRVDSNAAEIKDWMRTLFRDQVPFATSKAINETALKAQRAQREHQSREFTIRRRSFVQKAVKIKPFSRKSRLFADIQIDPFGGQARADILTKFESDLRKTPIRGSRIAIPTKQLRRTGTGIVPPSMRPSALDFKPHGRGRVFTGTEKRFKGDVFRGKKRTFMILRPGGRGAIFQRFGRRGSSEVRTIFTFAPSVDISDTRLSFIPNVTRVVRDQFDREFVKAFDLAVRTSR